MDVKNAFTKKDMEAFEPEAKMGLLCTVNPEGLPHITLITSIQAGNPSQVIWGQFSEGQSKNNVRTNQKTGFLILTMDRKLWTGKAVWTHEKKSGSEYDMYNEKPMFRYNAYFGIHTVHYMDLVQTRGPFGLPLVRILGAMAATRLLGGKGKVAGRDHVLRPWGRAMFNRLDALKFICWIADDGFPEIAPLIQCRAVSDKRLVFSPIAFSRQLRSIKKGQPVAIFSLTMKMEDILVRGFFRGFSRKKGLSIGAVDINWVYNSMPPVSGQIYPPTKLSPVVDFGGISDE